MLHIKPFAKALPRTYVTNFKTFISFTSSYVARLVLTITCAMGVFGKRNRPSSHTIKETLKLI